jgi:hypothetical protein
MFLAILRVVTLMVISTVPGPAFAAEPDFQVSVCESSVCLLPEELLRSPFTSNRTTASSLSTDSKKNPATFFAAGFSPFNGSL